MTARNVRDRGRSLITVVQITTLLSAQTLVWRGFYLGRHVRVCPSPSGRGWRGAPGEGLGMRQSWPSCGRATLSQREKDTPSRFLLIGPTVIIDRPVSWFLSS